MLFVQERYWHNNLAAKLLKQTFDVGWVASKMLSTFNFIQICPIDTTIGPKYPELTLGHYRVKDAM